MRECRGRWDYLNSKVCKIIDGGPVFNGFGRLVVPNVEGFGND